MQPTNVNVSSLFGKKLQLNPSSKDIMFGDLRTNGNHYGKTLKKSPTKNCRSKKEIN